VWLTRKPQKKKKKKKKKREKGKENSFSAAIFQDKERFEQADRREREKGRGEVFCRSRPPKKKKRGVSPVVVREGGNKGEEKERRGDRENSDVRKGGKKRVGFLLGRNQSEKKRKCNVSVDKEGGDIPPPHEKRRKKVWGEKKKKRERPPHR